MKTELQWQIQNLKTIIDTENSKDKKQNSKDKKSRIKYQELNIKYQKSLIVIPNRPYKLWFHQHCKKVRAL